MSYTQPTRLRAAGVTTIEKGPPDGDAETRRLPLGSMSVDVWAAPETPTAPVTSAGMYTRVGGSPGRPVPDNENAPLAGS